MQTKMIQLPIMFFNTKPSFEVNTTTRTFLTETKCMTDIATDLLFNIWSIIDTSSFKYSVQFYMTDI